MKLHHRTWTALLIAGAALLTANFVAADEDADRTVDLGKFELTAPEGWERREPKSRIVAHEFAVPAAEGDEQGGRVTLMSAGGSVKDNIARWQGQFELADGAEAPKPKKRKIAGQTVHVVDLSGTFKDSPGPVAPAVERENYRMLAGIIELKDGFYFVKFTGPQKTVTENEERFDEFLESLATK